MNLLVRFSGEESLSCFGPLLATLKAFWTTFTNTAELCTKSLTSGVSLTEFGFTFFFRLRPFLTPQMAFLCNFRHTAETCKTFSTRGMSLNEFGLHRFLPSRPDLSDLEAFGRGSQ